MEPSSYLSRYLEAAYLRDHPDLTEGARAMLHAQLATQPERYATDDHARALVSYTNLHARLHRELIRMDELGDEQFETSIMRLFDAMQHDVQRIYHADARCYDARLLDILLTDAPIDERMPHLLDLERDARAFLDQALPAFDGSRTPCWMEPVDAEAEPRTDAAYANVSGDLYLPELVGWLHTLEALAFECMAAARYRAAARYARAVHRTPGYRSLAVGTLLLCLARLEDEQGFFDAAREAGPEIEGTPWFLLGRTLLLYKLDRMRSATRALREFAARCEGGAFFLLNPTYHDPYLPSRPPAREAWELSHQAVWEADAIIVDTPDFTTWAMGVDGVEDAARSFAERRGF